MGESSSSLRRAISTSITASQSTSPSLPLRHEEARAGRARAGSAGRSKIHRTRAARRNAVGRNASAVADRNRRSRCRAHCRWRSLEHGQVPAAALPPVVHEAAVHQLRGRGGHQVDTLDERGVNAWGAPRGGGGAHVQLARQRQRGCMQPPSVRRSCGVYAAALGSRNSCAVSAAAPICAARKRGPPGARDQQSRSRPQPWS